MTETGEINSWVERLHTVLGVPPTQGNRVRVLRNGDEIFPAMLSAIDAARHTVDLVTFVYWSGEIAERFADSLADAARRGCRVRVVLDAVGARKLDEQLVGDMEASGVEVQWFHPIVDGPVPSIEDSQHRTHRKLLICDGQVGFTGGVGIAEPWTGDARDETEWRDSHVEVRGPAVAGLFAAFVDNWVDTEAARFDASSEPPLDLQPAGGSTCVVIRGAAESGASDLRRLLLTLIQLARHRIRIATAYFNPDDELLDALRSAIERQVRVEVLVPGEHADKRFVQLNGEGLYGELLEDGVSMYTYERSMMHAKVVTVDGVVASVGSANFNERSLQHDAECNLIILDPEVVAVLDEHFDGDLTVSAELDPAEWAERSLLQRAAERVASVADRWM